MTRTTDDERTARTTGQVLAAGILAVLLLAAMGAVATLVALAIRAVFPPDLLGG
jgi:hypothetical protein